METADPPRVGYVVKRYPRFSETFIVNEILAHEEAGLPVEVFSLRPCCDTHFQDCLAQVRAPVHYLTSDNLKAGTFWLALAKALDTFPGLAEKLSAARSEDASHVFQAILLANEVRQRNVAHLHAHFATESAAVARLAASFAGVSWSFTAHAKDIYHESTGFETLQRKLADADATITVSDYNLAYLRETFGAAAGRVKRLYNGLDLRRFPFFSGERSPRPLILAVGRLVEKKGFGDLVLACRLLADAGVSFTCQIVGAGELDEELRRQIAAVKLTQCVEMLGPLPLALVTKKMQEAAVLAAPCIVGDDGNRDGMPTVLLEAMALGAPCVATPVTGIPEIVRDGQTGLIVPERDPQALAAAIRRLLSEPALGARLAENARAQIERQFDIRHNAMLMRRMFRDAIRRASALRANDRGDTCDDLHDADSLDKAAMYEEVA